MRQAHDTFRFFEINSSLSQSIAQAVGWLSPTTHILISPKSSFKLTALCFAVAVSRVVGYPCGSSGVYTKKTSLVVTLTQAYSP